MFVLDTCLVSEFTKKTPDPGVLEWIRQQAESDLFITTVTLGEVVKGIERLPQGKKRSELEHWYANDLLVRFHGRIQSIDEAAGYEWGRLCARLELAGTPMPAVDSQIAAICILHGADLVTRNEADFVNSGVKVVNPWT
jgi:predicted nucleic acid-binding protein